MSIDLDIRTIPEWLKSSQFYRTIIENNFDCEEPDYIVPLEKRFITDKTSIINSGDILPIIEIMKFWCIDSLPEMFYDYFTSVNTDILVQYSARSLLEIYSKDSHFHMELMIASYLYTNKDDNKVYLSELTVPSEYISALSEEEFMNILKYLQKKGTGRDEIIFNQLILNDYINCIKYIVKTPELKGLMPRIRHDETGALLRAFPKDSIKCFKYMIETLGYKDPIIMSSSLSYRCTKCIIYIYENNLCISHSKYYKKNYIFNSAIELLNFDLIKYFIKQIELNDDYIVTAITSNTIKNKKLKMEIFKYIMDNAPKLTKINQLFVLCIENNFKEGLYYLIEQDYIPDDVVYNVAAEKGEIDILRYLDKKGYKYGSKETLKLAGKYAVSSGKLGASDCLNYLIRNECPGYQEYI